jgi:hypothetical protein
MGDDKADVVPIPATESKLKHKYKPQNDLRVITKRQTRSTPIVLPHAKYTQRYLYIFTNTHNKALAQAFEPSRAPSAVSTKERKKDPARKVQGH